MKFEVHIKDDSSKELAIIIPAYNEQDSIDSVIEKWSKVAKSCGGSIIVLNDGSQDKTGEKIQQQQEKYSNLIYIDKDNSGHGSSCVRGYQWAIDNDYKWIFQTDSDDQTCPEDFPKFWEIREEAPAIFGLRKKRGDGFIRLVISRVLSLSIFLIFGNFVKDANVPFRLMRSDFIKDLLPKIPKDLFLANAYLSVLINKKSPIVWQEIGFQNRSGGIPSVKLSGFFKVGIKVIQEFIKSKD